MADETFVGEGIERVWVSGSGENQDIYLTNGVDIIAGLVVTEFGETAATRDVDLASLTEEPLGIVLKAVRNAKLGVVRSLDTALDDNEQVWVQKKGGLQNIVYGVYQANGATIKRGTSLIVGSEAGKLAPWVYSEAGAASVATGVYIVGEAAEDVTQAASDDQIIKVRI